jgi:hypothetical protein
MMRFQVATQLSLEANTVDKLDPGDDDGGRADHHAEQSKGLLPAEPLDPPYEELKGRSECARG